MLACFDLAHNAPSYDTLTFLLNAEAERLRRGDPDLEEVRIKQAPTADGFRADRLWPSDSAERLRLLDRVCVPMVRMLPSVRDVHMTSPARTNLGFGEGKRFLYLFEALATGLRPLRPSTPEFARDPKLITMTLRECDHWPSRNSDVDSWIEAAQHLRAAGWSIVFVRDTYAKTTLDGFDVSRHAHTDLETRARLYRSAYCNMFVNNGPAWFCMALDAPTVVVKPTTDGAGVTHGREWFRRFGIRPGEQIPNTPAHQWLSWREDDAAGIVWAFLEWQAAMRSREHASALHG